jgi:HD-GYP domain-containing protein (c-di-GMP phosphodiesterase class II)
MDQTFYTKMPEGQLSLLEKFSNRVNNFGADFVAFDVIGEVVLDSPCAAVCQTQDEMKKFAADVLKEEFDNVRQLGGENTLFARCLKLDGETLTVGVISVAGQVVSDREKELVTEILETFAKDFEQGALHSQQIEMVSSELAQTYEELVLLYNMSTNMKVTQSNATYLQMACDQLTQLVNVEGIAIFLNKQMEDEDMQYVLTAGSGLIAVDQIMADILQLHLLEEMDLGREALLDSMVDSPVKYDWPERIKNIIAVPLIGGDKMIGFMVATNILGKPDFDSMETKLFNSVANQCAIFVENGRLFGDLKDLFIGSLKALTNSIDAKDQYTRGHSERVAFISRWIAEELSKHRSLEDEYIHMIYLSGLLHDIGKIGISESVLCKNGKLTEAEMNIIKSHPKIGASILSDIKQMSGIVSGVLCHHERPDGKGYPEGLTEKQIPLIAKIISLADAFDAMTSRRVYRDAMSIKRSLEQIEKGLGTQFDQEIGEIFIKSDVNRLWTIIQDGFIENWDYSNFDEYGTVAVGTLLR